MHVLFHYYAYIITLTGEMLAFIQQNQEQMSMMKQMPQCHQFPMEPFPRHRENIAVRPTSNNSMANQIQGQQYFPSTEIGGTSLPVQGAVPRNWHMYPHISSPMLNENRVRASLPLGHKPCTGNALNPRHVGEGIPTIQCQDPFTRRYEQYPSMLQMHEAGTPIQARTPVLHAANTLWNSYDSPPMDLDTTYHQVIALSFCIKSML